MALTCRPILERTRYWQGQRLRSRDLDNQLTDEAELRWWHNRALHDAFGVVEGLAVAGPTWASGGLLEVEPGLAYDSYGRELVVARRTTVPPPPPEPVERRGWVLVLRQAERGCEAPCRGAAAASPLGALLWIPSRLFVLPAAGVPLARGRYQALSAGFVLDEVFASPVARPTARPLIAGGATVAGKTAWRGWRTRYPNEQVAFGVEVTIDTSAAGFTDVPCYFAWLCGGHLALGSKVPELALDRIVDRRADRFTLSLWLPDSERLLKRGRTGKDDLASFARRQLHVCWLGLQQVEAAQPPSQDFYFEERYGNP